MLFKYIYYLWQLGEVPEDHKKAKVTPIFKKAKEEAWGNYRPVSFTSGPGKLEKKILETISNA